MLFSSHQSVLLPWAGFWHKAQKSDVMIINSGSDFCRQDYEHRVQLNGSWLTLEVDRKKSGKKISSVVLQPGTVQKAAQRIERELCVKKNKYSHRLACVLTLMNDYQGSSLAELNQLLLIELCNRLQLDTTLLFIDEVPQGDNKTDKLCNRVVPYMSEDDIYICGNGALDYLDFTSFPRSVMMQKPNHTGIDTGSILSIMVHHEDPIGHISDWFTYQNVSV